MAGDPPTPFLGGPAPLPGFGGAERTPPPAVKTAAKYMYAGAVLSGASILVGLTERGAIRTAVEKAAQPGTTQAQINAGVNLALGAAVAAGLIGIALWLWMARMNLKGRSWARITGTIFLGIETLFLFSNLANANPLLPKLTGAAVWLAGAGAGWYLWRSESTAFFTGKFQGTFG